RARRARASAGGRGAVVAPIFSAPRCVTALIAGCAIILLPSCAASTAQYVLGDRRSVCDRHGGPRPPGVWAAACTKPSGGNSGGHSTGAARLAHRRPVSTYKCPR